MPIRVTRYEHQAALGKEGPVSVHIVWFDVPWGYEQCVRRDAESWYLGDYRAPPVHSFFAELLEEKFQQALLSKDMDEKASP